MTVVRWLRHNGELGNTLTANTVFSTNNNFLKLLFTKVEVNVSRYLLSREALKYSSTTFNDTEMNNCFSI